MVHISGLADISTETNKNGAITMIAPFCYYLAEVGSVYASFRSPFDLLIPVAAWVCGQRSSDGVRFDERLGVDVTSSELSLTIILPDCFRERQQRPLSVSKSTDHKIAGLDLLGRDQIRKRINEKSLDRSFQVTSAVFEVDAFAKQEFLRLVGAFEDELGSGRFRDAILNGRQARYRESSAGDVPSGCGTRRPCRCGS